MRRPDGNPVVEAFERAAETYDRVGVDFFGPFGAELVHRAGLRPGERVLDVGCGRGAVLFPAARAVGPDGHVTGIDAAPSMVTLTRAEVANAGLRHVTVDVGDATRPDFPAGGFDVVTAGLVVFLLPDPAAALRAYADVLRRAAVAAAGFAPPARTSFGLTSRFVDERHWLAWCWSHGARTLLQAIPGDRLPAATADAFAALDGARTEAGDLAITTTIRVFTATRRS